MTAYSVKHWSRRIPEYLAAAWSSEPTPFARLACEYFPPGGRILELGAGAGQDGLWFSSQGFETVISDAMDIGFPAIKARASSLGIKVNIIQLDINKPFDFDDETFDVVYAQLVLHYFDDNTLMAIVEEIRRVLKSGGIFASMVNSTKDPEYSKIESKDLMEVGDLMKRYFTKESFAPFVKEFKTILFDENGQTPKDDKVSNTGMVQFIGEKK